MYSTILIAFLISAAPDSPSLPESDAPSITVGTTSFTGDSIRLTKDDGNAFECRIDGHSVLTIAIDENEDISVSATSMVISRDADSKFTIQCNRDCKLTDSVHTVCADQFQIEFDNLPTSSRDISIRAKSVSSIKGKGHHPSHKRF